MNVLFATVRASEIGGNYLVSYLCTIIEEAVHDANSTWEWHDATMNNNQRRQLSSGCPQRHHKGWNKLQALSSHKLLVVSVVIIVNLTIKAGRNVSCFSNNVLNPELLFIKSKGKGRKSRLFPKVAAFVTMKFITTQTSLIQSSFRT